eukprot:COSAG05_NODE_1591_length_4465_cov_35.183830_2_plen_186_part_00
MFWSVVKEMTGPQRRQLLGFCWGRSRLPANPTQPFTIDSQGGSDDQKLPQSHTCSESHTKIAVYIVMYISCATIVIIVSLNVLELFCYTVFQLHLPRYSTRDILKERLLTAIQNSGSRSNSSALTRTPHSEDDGPMKLIIPRAIPPTVAIDVPADGGHVEDLRSFSVRAGVGLTSLKQALSVPDM